MLSSGHRWLALHLRTFIIGRRLSALSGAIHGRRLKFTSLGSIGCVVNTTLALTPRHSQELGVLVLGDDVRLQRGVAAALNDSGRFRQVVTGSRPCHVNAQWNTKSVVRSENATKQCMEAAAADWIALASAEKVISACGRHRSSGFAFFAALYGHAMRRTALYHVSRTRITAPGVGEQSESCSPLERDLAKDDDGTWSCGYPGWFAHNQLTSHAIQELMATHRELEMSAMANRPPPPPKLESSLPPRRSDANCPTANCWPGSAVGKPPACSCAFPDNA